MLLGLHMWPSIRRGEEGRFARDIRRIPRKKLEEFYDIATHERFSFLRVNLLASSKEDMFLRHLNTGCNHNFCYT